MALPTTRTPRARILIRMAGVLRNADLAGLSGVANITVRHTRNRWANAEEKPAISLRMVSDEPRDDDQYHTLQERVCELAVDMQVDADLQTEDSELDPTGVDRLGAIANAALAVLKDRNQLDADGLSLYLLCDGVLDLGVQNDDDNEADEARFIHRIVVLYRTDVDDPNVLLAEGENLP